MTHFLWITDPWETLAHSGDTTLRLAEASLELGFKSSWCDVRSIQWQEDRVTLEASEILKIGPNRRKNDFQFGALRKVEPHHFTQIHYRTDPPVDLAYLHPLQLLVLGLEKKLGAKGPSRIVNPPQVLISNIEKLEAGFLSNLMPPSLASSQWSSLAQFGCQLGQTVLKPLHEAQSHGVELLDWQTDTGKRKAHSLLKKSTHQFTQPVLLQKYLSGIRFGETRLWFLDGKLLAHTQKLPLSGDFRVNIDRGSRLAVSTLTDQDRIAVRRIGQHLRKRGIRLAAVDLIEGFITDFNFTSPGLIVQMEQILKKNLASKIIKQLTNPMQISGQ